jgi:eukaryotic-like serine/threonine-protein kinase
MSVSVNTEVLAARYRLDHLIASGGMGEVWRAVDLVLDRPVAVKLLHAEYAQHAETVARFRAEARHAANLSHPSIAQVYDFGEAIKERPAFLVMELIAGPPLTEVLANGPLPPARVLDVVAQVAAGLAAAHAAGVVHRDIKPGNLLVDRSGAIKITDFGIAHALGSAPLTRTGALIGTPAYLAPERVNGQAAGPPSDLYSLGMVAYECLAGSLPFTGTALEIALAHQHQSLPPLPAAVPHEVAELIAQLTASDPARRPASAGVVAARARALADAIGGPMPAAGASSQGPEAGLTGAESWASASRSGMGDRTLIDIPYAGGSDRIAMASGHDGRGLPPLAHRPRRRPSRKSAALAAAAIAVVASLAGWAVASAPGSAPPQGQAPGPSGSKAAARAVTVDPAALLGQPVRAVESQLHQLGLRVDLAWQPSHDQRPGTVLSVQPSGKILAGSTVAVTGASQPNGDHHDHGHGGDGHGGNGNGQGGD